MAHTLCAPLCRQYHNVLKELTDLAIVVVANITKAAETREEKRALINAGVPFVVWTGTIVSLSRFVAFYNECILSHVFSEDPLQPSLGGISSQRSTRSVTLGPDRLSARNDSWSFETAVSDCGATGSGRYYYEVRIESTGIVQVRLQCANCKLSSRCLLADVLLTLFFLSSH